MATIVSIMLHLGFSSINPDTDALILILCNCTGIGGAIWFYKLKPVHA
jgi:hypothetical protein